MKLIGKILLATLVLLASPDAGADDDIQIQNNPPSPGRKSSSEVETRGMVCVPQVREVETRRPIPFSCETDYEVAGVEVRYRLEGGKWAKVELENQGGTWTGMIPCTATNDRGVLAVYAFARNDANKVVARIGRSSAPMHIRLVDQSKVPPPSLPNHDPPSRCFDSSDCPPEMLGTAACPGTKPSKAAKRAWGASCTETPQCQTGLECMNGNCDNPQKCERPADCPDGSECDDGICHFPTREELAERLGPPKHHWIGLHAGADFILTREADGVCGPDGAGQTEDSKRYACYQAGNPYTGTPANAYAGHLSSSARFATVRALVSYDYALQRLLFGGRIGWAFRGAPKHFTPLHIEARALYSVRKDVFNKNFRPYLGLAGGYAEVDSAGSVRIVDCVDSASRQACRTATASELNAYLLPDGNGDVRAVQRVLNAYRSGSHFFFGPTLHMVFALANDSAIVFNLNVMFPDTVFEPTLGYEIGL